MLLIFNKLFYLFWSLACVYILSPLLFIITVGQAFIKGGRAWSTIKVKNKGCKKETRVKNRCRMIKVKMASEY